MLAAAGYLSAGGYNVYVSRNAGSTWVQTSQPGPQKGLAVSVSGNGQVLLASELGGLLYTSSSGADWTTRAVSYGNLTWGTTAASQNGSRLVAAVFQGIIYTSSDQVRALLATLAGACLQAASRRARHMRSLRRPSMPACCLPVGPTLKGFQEASN